MSHALADKVAVVTGGAGGLGRATVERFAEEGAKVVIADVDVEAGELLASELGPSVAFQRTDVANVDDVQALVDVTVAEFGGLDVIFNNAGIAEPLGGFLQDDFASFERVMAVDLLGVMVCSQRAGRYMAAHGGGCIINNSSIGGINAGPGVMTYRAAKAAVIHISKCIALELAHHAVRVNCVAPGHIATEMTQYDMEAVVRLTQPLQRQGVARDLANAVLYLASDQAAQITGVVLPVDGGTTVGGPVRRSKESEAR